MEELRTRKELRLSVSQADVDEEQQANAVSTAESSNLSAMPSCDQYDLISLLGQGGMGNVYRARNKALGTEVAIKVIHPNLVADPAALKRFEQEAKAASSLTHANLVAVYDHGTTNVGTPFLVMDLLHGSSLAEAIKSEGFLDVPRALDVFIQICDALTHAHLKGVVHRDLKPSNVLLTKADNDVELVKIIDFGIAKLLAKTESSITQTGDVFGSPAYMSPEQCLGLETDARSDVYSLGCIMYECLTGHLPFGGDNPIQTIVQHINEQPKLFGSDCNDLSIPDTLKSVILNTLEKDAGKRYQSMEELRNDLQRIKDGASPLRVRVPEKKKKKKIRAGTVVAIAVIVLSSLVAAKVGLENGAHQASVFPFGDARAKTTLPQRWVMVSGPSGPQAASLTAGQFPLPSHPFQLRDTHNRLLFTSKEAHNISEAVNEAVREDADLTGVNLAGLALTNVTVMPSTHKGKFAGADFSKCKLGSVSFFNTDLHGAKFTDASFEYCGFQDCSLIAADFSGSRLKPSTGAVPLYLNFAGSNLTDANFTGAYLPDGWYSEIMSGAKLAHGDFSRGHFSFRNLSGVDFTGSVLKNADLDHAILSNAKFQGADLTNAVLRGCVGANFQGARNARVSER